MFLKQLIIRVKTFCFTDATIIVVNKDFQICYLKVYYDCIMGDFTFWLVLRHNTVDTWQLADVMISATSCRGGRILKNSVTVTKDSFL